MEESVCHGEDRRSIGGIVSVDGKFLMGVTPNTKPFECSTVKKRVLLYEYFLPIPQIPIRYTGLTVTCASRSTLSFSAPKELIHHGRHWRPKASVSFPMPNLCLIAIKEPFEPSMETKLAKLAEFTEPKFRPRARTLQRRESVLVRGPCPAQLFLSIQLDSKWYVANFRAEIRCCS